MKPITKHTKKSKYKTPTSKKMGTTLNKNSSKNDHILIVLKKTSKYKGGWKSTMKVMKIEQRKNNS